MAGGRTALVTGGSGFLGSHMVDALLAAGYRVRCLVRATSRLRWLEGKPVELHEADLAASGGGGGGEGTGGGEGEGGGEGGGDLSDAVAGVDHVYHFAALTRGSRQALWAANHEGTRRLLAACAEQDRPIRFVFCSSQAAAGPSPQGRPREESDPPSPTSEYGRSKLAAEEEVLRHRQPLEVVVLRPAAAYGPRDEDTLPYFRMAARGVIPVPGLRKRLLQLVHARDVAAAARLAGERAEAVGGTYFVAHPEIVTWAKLAENIRAAMGRRALALRVPSPLLRALGTTAQALGGGRRAGRLDRRRARDLTQMAWTCRVDRALIDLGWSPTYDLARGLEETANWYRENGWV